MPIRDCPSSEEWRVTDGLMRVTTLGGDKRDTRGECCRKERWMLLEKGSGVGSLRKGLSDKWMDMKEIEFRDWGLVGEKREGKWNRLALMEFVHDAWCN